MGNILLIKGKYSSPTNDNYLKAISVGLALAGQIFMSGNVGGACYNPAVALANISLFVPLLNNYFGYDSHSLESAERHLFKEYKEAMLHYMWVFLLMPLVAAVVLGLVQSVHESNCEVMAKAAKKEQAETKGEEPMLRDSINYE